ISRFRASACWQCIGPDSRSSLTGISSIASCGAREMLSLWANLESVKLLGILQRVAVPRERVQQEIIPIKVILQIKDAGKACSRKLLFIPRAIGILLFEQMPHGLFHGRIIPIGCGQETNQAPSGLRRCAGALAFQFRIVVRSDGFPKTAVVILHRAKTGHGTLAIITGAECNRCETPQNGGAAMGAVSAPPIV